MARTSRALMSVTFLAESKSKGQKFPDIPFITTPTTVEYLSRPHPIIQPVAAATMSTTVMGFDEQKLRNTSEKFEGTVTRFHKLEFKLPRVFTSAHPERLATKQMDTYRGESESRKEAKTETKMETSTEIGTPATHMSAVLINCTSEPDTYGEEKCRQWKLAGFCRNHAATKYLFCRRQCFCIKSNEIQILNIHSNKFE
ncbi:hypothetical protein DdX_19857 [Ditylenchus destructor]|uniref:ShKT domain-containing protein n=1 Tax=Ditylenchus destructor TaxID=166010 RepID=A0AAD4QWW9_9BILA|nr:hypothetical protein DdX_19857 [Ditylenchus destructor]